MIFVFISKLLTILPILSYPFINVLVLILLGLGPTYLIVPKSLKSFIFWLSPWTTIISSIFYFVIMSLMGISVSQSIVPYIIILLIINAYVLLKKKPKLIPAIKTNFIRNTILGIIVSASLILSLSPLIRRDKILTTISMGNNDVIVYTRTGDYLKNNSIKESFQTEVDTSIGTILNAGYRWGTPMINAFFLTLLNLEGYQYTYISQAILFSLMVPLSYILFRILYGQSSLLGLLMVTVFTAFNANLLYILYHDFFGQILYWGISLLMLILFYSYFKSKQIKHKKFNRYDFLLGITITVLYFSYHEPAVFMLAPLFIFLFMIFLRNKKAFKNYFFTLLKIAIVSLVTGFQSIYNATIFNFKQVFMANYDQPIGWQLFRSKIPYANPFEAMGFWSIHNFAPMTNLLAIFFSLLIILIFIKGFIKSRSRALSLSYLVIFSLFLYWTGFYLHNFFTYNRALTYSLPLLIVLFTIGLVSLFKKQKFFFSLVIITLLVLELRSAIHLNKRFITERLSVDKSYISILDLKNINIKENIYAELFIKGDISLWKQMWTDYFLYSKDVSVVPTKFNDNPYENRVPNNALVLTSKATPWYKPLKIIKNNIWSNDYYELGRICNNEDCLIKTPEKLNEILIGNNNYEDSLLISGWGVTERNTRWANRKESILRLVTTNKIPKNFVIEALTLKEPQEITVFLENKLLGTIPLTTDWQEYTIPIGDQLEPGVHQLKFVYSNEYRPMDIIPGNLDACTLFANFREIKLE